MRAQLEPSSWIVVGRHDSLFKAEQLASPVRKLPSTRQCCRLKRDEDAWAAAGYRGIVAK